MRRLASAASSVGWNRSRIVEFLGLRVENVPATALQRIPHALRAHLLYLQLSEGDNAAYEWHSGWFERLSAVQFPQVFVEYAAGAKGVYRRAVAWSNLNP